MNSFCTAHYCLLLTNSPVSQLVILWLFDAANAETIITADQAVRGGKVSDLKTMVDKAVATSPCVKKSICGQSHRCRCADGRDWLSSWKGINCGILFLWTFSNNNFIECSDRHNYYYFVVPEKISLSSEGQWYIPVAREEWFPLGLKLQKSVVRIKKVHGRNVLCLSR